jgi:hypothetical protein
VSMACHDDIARSALLWCCLVCVVSQLGAAAHAEPAASREATPDEIAAFFRQQGKKVLTFVGYSGAGYQDQGTMLRAAARILDDFEPAKTIVNIGATPDGIGAVYELARRRGFTTTGIISTQAKREGVALSPDVDQVFFVEDESWGGFLPGSERLSPTSKAMVECSDVIVGVGGGEVARDEMIAARRAGKTVRFIPADMDHEKARAKARKKGAPEPTDFRGAAGAAFRDPASRASAP